MFSPLIRALRRHGLMEPKIKRTMINSFAYKTAPLSSSSLKSAAKESSKDKSSVDGDKKEHRFSPSPVNELFKELLTTTSFTQRTLSDSIPLKKNLSEEGFQKLYHQFSSKLRDLMALGNSTSDAKLPHDVQQILIETAVHKSIPYLISSSACSHVCSMLGDLSDPSTAFVINSPGPGLLATEMLKQGTRSLHLFEKNPDFHNYLATAFKNEPNVAVHNQDVLSLMWRLRTNDVNRLEFLKVLDSNKYSTIKIILVIDNIGQFGIMLGNHLSGFFPSNKKKIEFYFMVPSAVGELLDNLTLNNFGRRGIRGLWALFATSEHIGSIPSTSVFPPFLKKNSFTRNNRNIMVFRSGFREISSETRCLKEAERPYLALFTRHHVPQSTESVVSALEKWIPGIGLPLVLSGLSVFTRFRDLSIEQYLEVFFLFYDKSSPDSSIWAMLEDQRFVEAKAISADSVTQP